MSEEFYDALQNNDVIEVRHILARIPELHKLSSRVLNEDYPLSTHEFTKWHDHLVLIPNRVRKIALQRAKVTESKGEVARANSNNDTSNHILTELMNQLKAMRIRIDATDEILAVQEAKLNEMVDYINKMNGS